MPDLIREQFTPLAERAVRSDGTIGIRIIGPGWGSSGYYDRAVLERDVPRVFPRGTHMYWNHPTMTESLERPERDLRDLAAVTVSDPYWLEAGPAGPGMYADAAVVSGYREAIDEIGEHIGVSILAGGVREPGEAEGRRGNIIREITAAMPPGSPTHPSVDFVTRPGAGGAIVSIFESAPGSARLPEPERISEAANLAEWLESRLHLHLTQIADELFGDGRINREERLALSSAIGPALTEYRRVVMEEAPALFARELWRDAPPSADIPAEETSESARPETNRPDNQSMEATMSDEALQEAQTQIAALQEQRQSDQAVIESLRERLLLSEARAFVDRTLATADLPDMTRARLARQLLANPPIANGQLDEAAYTTAIETAVTEAQAEIAAVVGNSGRITGNGGGPATTAAPTLEESQARIREALSRLPGYGGAVNGH